jgi:hypothetical protein
MALPERSLKDEEVAFLDLNPELEQEQSMGPRHRLSVTQQSKFINYVDEKLLEIHRKFVKTVGMGQYSSAEILGDLQQLVEFIWLSIHREDSRSLFGQVDYLLTIAGDLLEFVDKLTVHGVSSDVLELLDSLDNKFVVLLPIMKQTEVVRLVSIAERTRPLVFTSFEKANVTGYHDELAKVYERVLERV